MTPTPTQALEPCPFCGDPMRVYFGTVQHIQSERDDCPIAKYAWEGTPRLLAKWNQRPCHNVAVPQALEPVEVTQAEEIAALLVVLARDYGLPSDIQELLLHGAPLIGVKPGVLKAILRHRQSSNAASVGSFRDHLNAVLDTSGARGTYHALRYTEAVEAAERALASLSTPTADAGDAK